MQREDTINPYGPFLGQFLGNKNILLLLNEDREEQQTISNSHK